MNEGKNANGGPSEMKPSVEYEQLRRRIRSNILEMYYYVSAEFKKPNRSGNVNDVIHLTAEHKRSLISDMDKLQQSDGFEQWRHTEAEDLSKLVQGRLSYLQNPKDCAKARKIVCRPDVVRIFYRIYFLIILYEITNDSNYTIRTAYARSRIVNHTMQFQ